MNMTTLMKLKSVRNTLLCSVMAIPGLTVATAQAQTQAEPCVQLQAVGDQIDFEASNVSQDEFNQIVQGNDAQQCELWLSQVGADAAGEVTETERARVRLEDEVVIEGRVIVDQPQPNVEIDESPAEVSVGNVTPQIGITQEPIDILIRQGAPRISLDMPQPTIQIEQPAPEIIITMPDPSVEVGETRPQVEVRQAEPQVRITMADPTVELDLYQAEDAETSTGIAVERRQPETGTDGAAADPVVTMNRAEAQIIFQESDQQQAEVSITRTEPNIRFEQSEPELEITSAGDPQVNWSQIGEATITFEDNTAASPDQQDQAGAAADQDAALTEQQDDAAQTEQAQNGQSALGGPNVRRDGYEGVQAEEILATELDGATVHAVRGDEIGEIGVLVLSETQPQTAIIEVGAMQGTEARAIEVPFSDLTFLRGEDDGSIRVYFDASDERLMDYPEAQQ